MLLFYIFIMKTATMLGVRTLCAYQNELISIQPMLQNAGMDIRNNTKVGTSFSDISELMHKKRQFDFLESPSIGKIQKLALAEMVLDEYFYPTKKLSKYKMNIMAGGLFQGWDYDEEQRHFML